MAASLAAPSFAHQIEHALNKARDTLTRATGNAGEQRICDALERIDHIASNVAAGLSANDEPTNDVHISQASKRNAVSPEEYDQYADTKTVVVRMYEVGQCKTCNTVGPSGFCCDCGGRFGTRMNGGIPKHIVRLTNDYLQDEDDAGAGAASSASSNKKRKKAARKSSSKKPPAPKTLEEFASMLFWSGVGSWAENCDGYPGAIHEQVELYFQNGVDEKNQHYWTEQVSLRLFDTIDRLIPQIAKVVDGFFPKEMKQRELYWEPEGDSVNILKLVKNFSKKVGKKKKRVGKKKKKKKK